MWLTAEVWVHILRKNKFYFKAEVSQKGTSTSLFLWTPSCKGFVGKQNLCKKNEDLRDIYCS